MGASTKKDLFSALLSAVFGLLFSVTVEPWIEDLRAIGPKPAAQESTISLPPAEPPDVGGGRERPELGVPVETPPVFTEGVDTDGRLRRIRRIARGRNGELAYLEITILDAEHYWPIGRADVIMTPGDREEDIFEFLDSSGLAKKIEKAEDIIAVGMASCESDDQTTEESRAEARAHQLVNWVRRLGTLASDTQLYTANLGQFEDTDCPENSYQTRLQRNAILVSVVYKKNISSSRDLGRLIKAELTNKDRLGLDIEKYSQPGFELRLHS